MHQPEARQRGSWNRRIGVLALLLVVLGVFAYSAFVNLADKDHQVELTKD